MVYQEAAESDEGKSIRTGRRKLIERVLSFIVAAAFLGRPATALATRRAVESLAEVSILTYGADPTGNVDSSPAFQAAAAALPITGGTIYVPPGHYLCASQINLPSIQLSIIGDGRNVSILIIKHNGIGLNFAPNSPRVYLSVRAVGFSPVGNGGQPACAVAVTLLSSEVRSSPSCTIQELDLGVVTPGFSGFYTGIELTNVWRPIVRDVSMMGGGQTPASGSTLITLNAFCVDCRFIDCSVNMVDVAFVVTGYCEGIHLINPIIANCNRGFYNQFSVSHNGNNSINILALYISGGEFGCNYSALNLYQVWTAWISDTHFGTNIEGPTIALIGCLGNQFRNCLVTGQATSQAGSQFVGFSLLASPTAGCADNIMDGTFCTNLSIAFEFGLGVVCNTALGTRFVPPQQFPILLDLPAPVIDLNGANSLNNVEWVTAVGGLSRFQYLR
jgi:hypothetical protein